VGIALAAAALALLLELSPVNSQQTFNEREIKSQPTALDKQNVWSLDFRFKDPRIIKATIPGRGTRICWYLWYQVINRTKDPHTFIPDFELVTLDYPGAFRDEVLPSVQEEIRRVEDVSGYQDIKNSVTIASKPIPPSKAEDAYPRAITGVAIWDGGQALGSGKTLADTNRFSIFVSGLSNGWVQVDNPTGDPNAPPLVRRKTLQINFKRVGDRDTGQIQFAPPWEWMYRAAPLRVPGAEKKQP
jgi:hypothetical protein